MLIIFLVVLAKDIFINEFNYINPYTPANRIISWFIILPISLVGTILSIRVLTLLPASIKAKLGSIDLYLVLPFVLYVCYFVVQIILEIIVY